MEDIPLVQTYLYFKLFVMNQFLNTVLNLHKMDVKEAFDTYARALSDLTQIINSQNNESTRYTLQNILNEITYKTEQMKQVVFEEQSITPVICAPPPPPPPLPPIKAPNAKLLFKSPGSKLPPSNPSNDSPHSSLSGDFLAEIRSGKKLKHVEVEHNNSDSSNATTTVHLKKTDVTQTMGMPMGMMDGILKQRMNLRKVSPNNNDDHNTEIEQHEEVQIHRPQEQSRMFEQQQEGRKRVKEEQERQAEEQRKKESEERVRKAQELQRQRELERKQNEERERVRQEEEANMMRIQQEQQRRIQREEIARQRAEQEQRRVDEQRRQYMLLEQQREAQRIKQQEEMEKARLLREQQFRRPPVNVAPVIQPNSRSYVVPQQMNRDVMGDLQDLEDSLGDDLDFLDDLE
jgi:hypothetical protein